MPSPFPGMDPYLEDPARWGGVHTRLIVAAATELNRLLPDGIVAEIDEYLWVHDTESEEETLLGKPDVFLPESEKRTGGGKVSIRVQVTLPTTRGKLPKNRKRKNRFVQVQTARGERVFTVIEILRPSNKGTGEDRGAYVQKRQEYLATVNLVEIDLLRAGHRLPMGRPTPPVSDYYVFSCQRDDYPATATWAFSVRESLPTIPVPVNNQLSDVPLNLGGCLSRVYDEGRYSDKVSYDVPPDPPLDRSDAEWAAELLKKHAKKKK